jgi:hypothetical protein
VRAVRTTRDRWRRRSAGVASVVTAAVLVVTALGINSSGVWPWRAGFALGAHTWVELLSARGSLGLVVLQDRSGQLAPSTERGRAYRAIFDPMPGPFLFKLSVGNEVTWFLAPSSNEPMKEVSWQDFTLPLDIVRSDFYCPAPAVLALCALWPAAVWLRTRRSGAWQRAGRCAACGYDLRGSAGPRCPECGAGFEKAGSHGCEEPSGGVSKQR